MKKLFIIAIVALMVLSSCNKTTPDISNESTFLEMSENINVSYEYHDGENDYTVITEKFNDDGTVSETKKEHYVEGVLADLYTESDSKVAIYTYHDGFDDYTEDIEIYSPDGTVEKAVSKIKNGKTLHKEEIVVFNDGACEKHIFETDEANTYKRNEYISTYIQKTYSVLGENGETIMDTKYYTLDGELRAKGTATLQNIGQKVQRSESIEIFKNGEPAYYQKFIMYDDNNVNADYSVELYDAQNNLILTEESVGGIYTQILHDAKIRLVRTSETDRYYDGEGNLIAEVEGFSVSCGDKYTESQADELIDTAFEITDEIYSDIYIPNSIMGESEKYIAPSKLEYHSYPYKTKVIRSLNAPDFSENIENISIDIVESGIASQAEQTTRKYLRIYYSYSVDGVWYSAPSEAYDLKSTTFTTRTGFDAAGDDHIVKIGQYLLIAFNVQESLGRKVSAAIEDTLGSEAIEITQFSCHPSLLQSATDPAYYYEKIQIDPETGKERNVKTMSFPKWYFMIVPYDDITPEYQLTFTEYYEFSDSEKTNKTVLTYNDIQKALNNNAK